MAASLMERSVPPDTESMTAVFKRRKELKKAVRVARLFVALDEAASGGRGRRRARPRATLGKA